MLKARLITLFGLAVLFIGLIAVFVRVLDLRFSSGEIYPNYSTLRSDPLGARAIYEALEALDGITVSRNFDDLMAIRDLDGESALVLCGLGRQTFDRLRAPESSPVLQAVEQEGARLVIIIHPELVPARFDLEDNEEDQWWKRREALRKKRESESEARSESKSDAPETREAEDPGETITDQEIEKLREEFELELEEQSGPRLTRLLEIEMGSPDSFERPDDGWTLEPGRTATGDPAPEALPPWYSQFRFEDLGEAWAVVASVDGEPVVVERALGQGTVVLTSDAYFASNEALWLGTEPSFLLWLAGGKRKLVFDETIHGSTETGGVIKLLRQYRLHGFFLGLLLFVILLAWKSGTSLAPGSESLERGLVDPGGTVAGEESASGLVRLLRRSIPGRDVLGKCIEVHRGSSAGRARREHSGQSAAIDQVIAEHREHPDRLGTLEAYRRITRILAHPDAYSRDLTPAPPPGKPGGPPPLKRKG